MKCLPPCGSTPSLPEMAVVAGSFHHLVKPCSPLVIHQSPFQPAVLTFCKEPLIKQKPFCARRVPKCLDAVYLPMQTLWSTSPPYLHKCMKSSCWARGQSNLWKSWISSDEGHAPTLWNPWYLCKNPNQRCHQVTKHTGLGKAITMALIKEAYFAYFCSRLLDSSGLILASVFAMLSVSAWNSRHFRPLSRMFGIILRPFCPNCSNQ